MDELKPIYFLEPVPPYNRCEIAGFEPKVANDYIRKRWAVPLDEDGEPILDYEPEPTVLDTDGLPKGLPGHEALIEAEITTLEELREVEDLEGIKGIGKKTADRIRAFLAGPEEG